MRLAAQERPQLSAASACLTKPWASICFPQHPSLFVLWIAHQGQTTNRGPAHVVHRRTCAGVVWAIWASRGRRSALWPYRGVFAVWVCHPAVGSGRHSGPAHVEPNLARWQTDRRHCARPRAAHGGRRTYLRSLLTWQAAGAPQSLFGALSGWARPSGNRVGADGTTRLPSRTHVTVESASTRR